MQRRGLGKGLGKGYYNLVPKDPYIHSLSAKGVKTKRRYYRWDDGKLRLKKPPLEEPDTYLPTDKELLLNAKSLSDLKRDLKIGTELLLKQRFGKEENKVKKIISIQSNGVWLEDESGKQTFLEFPKSSLLEYDGKTIKIYNAGFRDLMPEEKEIIANEPKDPEQEKIDMLTDGSTMYYRKKKYYKDLGKEYLFGGAKKIKGLRKTYKNGKIFIEDDNIKGNLILSYEIVK